jgi:hypothetical protein
MANHFQPKHVAFVLPEYNVLTDFNIHFYEYSHVEV